MADKKKGKELLDAVNEKFSLSDKDKESFEKLLMGEPHGAEIASKVTDNPYLGAALATAIDAAPMALGLLHGESPGIAGKLKEVGEPLNMGHGARMERAHEQGYDLEMPLYHSSDAKFTEFKPSEKGRYGPGIYTFEGNGPEHGYGENSYKLVAKKGKIFDASEIRTPEHVAAIKKTLNELGLPTDFENMRRLEAAMEKGPQHIRYRAEDGHSMLNSALEAKFGDKVGYASSEPFTNNFLSDNGYVGLRGNLNGDDVRVIFKPEHVREFTKAAFDPAQVNSKNMLSGQMMGAPQDGKDHYAEGGSVAGSVPASLAMDPQPQAAAPSVSPSAPAPTGDTVNMMDPGTGEIGSVPVKYAQRYLHQGYQLATPEETDSFIKEQKYGGAGQQLLTGVEGAAKAATFGLSTGVERAVGVPKEDIQGREETNPVSSFLGQGAGLIGSSFIPGVGAANIMEQAGAAGARALGLEGTSALSRIGSAAVKGAIENGIYQSGDEVSKMLLSNPNQSVQTAITNVGLASLLGAGISGGIGVVSPLWKASTGEKFGQWLEAIQRRANGEAAALPEEVQAALDRLGIDKSQVPPELLAGMGGAENVRQQFQILQESQTPAGLKLQETLKGFKAKLGEINDINKDELKTFIGDVQEGLREGTHAEAIKAREELETLRDQIRSQNFEDKSKADALLNGIKTGVEAAKARAQVTGDEEILKAFGFEPASLKSLGDISIKNAGAQAEESLIHELRQIVEPAQEKYEALAAPLKKVALTPADDVLADELATMAEAKGLTFMADSPQNRLVQRAMQGLTEARDIEQLMKLQSDIGAAGRNDLSLIHASKNINQVLQDGIERVLDRELGKKGEQVFSQWLDAKKSWRDVRGVLDELGQRLKPGKYGGPETFIGALKNKKRDEAILQALTKDKDADLLKLLESRFPNTSDKVKRHALEELLGEAKLKAKDGRVINSDWLMSQLDQMTPEYRDWLLKAADESSARQAHLALDKKLQALEAEGSQSLEKSAKEIEKSKLGSRAAQDAMLNDLKDQQQKRLFEMRETARAEMDAKKLSAAQKLEDIRLINQKLFHKSSNTAGNLDALWSMVPGGAMAMASMLVGHNPAIGWMIGQTGKWVMRDAPDAVRLAFLKFLGHEGPVEPEAFKSMVDFIHSTIKGQNQVIKATKAVFKAGQVVVPNSLVPTEKDRHRLEKSLMELRKDPSPLMDAGGKTSHYMPEHGASIGQTAATAVNYLNTLRPNTDKQSPLDAELPVNPVKKAQYNKALDIAQQPLMVLENIKNGTLVAQDVAHLQALYPELAAKFKQHLMDEIIARTHNEEPIPYKTRMSLSLFMGQALDSTMTPMALNLSQPMHQPSAPQANGQPGMKQKHSIAAINKMGKEELTPGQAREARRLQA